MSRARETYFCLRLVEYTSIPLAFCIMLYLLSGYGIVSPIFRLIGLTYHVSIKLHTLPLLRFVTALLTILHLYGGVVLILNRHVRSEKINEIIKLSVLAILLIFLFLIVLSELVILFRLFS
ncbi:MAG: hypothetical protein QN229_03710 [Desulfurococcaceae archaeon TW002]